MPVKFSANEVFEMAVEIEINGAKFYRHSVKCISDAKLKKLFNELADKEDQHKMVFSLMREELNAKEKKLFVADIDNQLQDYLHAMADGYVFQKVDDACSLVDKKSSIEDIFLMAIGFEKDSIVFYSGLKEMVPADSGRDKIEKIIKEEMSHITILNSELMNIRRR